MLGYTSGLAFMVVEESVRAWVQAFTPSDFDLLFRLLSAADASGFSCWPFGSRGFALDGEVAARYAGHHILTALVAGDFEVVHASFTDD